MFEICMSLSYEFYVSTVMPDLAEVLRHFDSKVCNPSEGTKIGYHDSVHSLVTRVPVPLVTEPHIERE